MCHFVLGRQLNFYAVDAEYLAWKQPTVGQTSAKCRPHLISVSASKELWQTRAQFGELLQDPFSSKWSKNAEMLKIYQEDIRMMLHFEVVTLSSSGLKLYICWIEMNECVNDSSSLVRPIIAGFDELGRDHRRLLYRRRPSCRHHHRHGRLGSERKTIYIVIESGNSLVRFV